MPIKGKLGLRDTSKIFSAKVRNHRNIYDARQISQKGCLVIVRPDQFVADVMPLTDLQRLGEFFKDVFTSSKQTAL